MTLALTVRDGDVVVEGEGGIGEEKENLVKLVPKNISSHFRSLLFFRPLGNVRVWNATLCPILFLPPVLANRDSLQLLIAPTFPVGDSVPFTKMMQI